MPEEHAKNDKDAISVIKDSQKIPFNGQETRSSKKIPRNKEAPDELKTPEQFQANEILDKLRKNSLLMYQLKDSGMLTDADKKKMKKIEREIKEKEGQLKRLKLEATRKKSRWSTARSRSETFLLDFLLVIQEIASARATINRKRLSE